MNTGQTLSSETDDSVQRRPKRTVIIKTTIDNCDTEITDNAVDDDDDAAATDTIALPNLNFQVALSDEECRLLYDYLNENNRRISKIIPRIVEICEFWNLIRPY